MRSALLVSVLALVFGTLSGCTTEQVVETKPYECPTCKDTIVWKYRSTKPWIVEGKEVVHSCPDCKKEWSANVKTSSTCAMCATATMTCPTCAAMKK